MDKTDARIDTSIPILVVFSLDGKSISFKHDGKEIPAIQVLSLLALGKGHVVDDSESIEYSLNSGQKFYRQFRRFLIRIDLHQDD